MLDLWGLLKKFFYFSARFSKRYFQKTELADHPGLSIEVTNFCNSNCVFCPNKIMQRPREHLDTALFKKIVAEFVDIGGINISFNTCIGEPLLDPCLLERAKYVKQFPQIKFSGLNTTLQWLHKFDINEFFESGITRLCISTVLSGREKYIEFFGVDGYEQVLKNIIMLIEENKKRENKMTIIFSIKPTNEPIKAVINHPGFKLVDALMNRKLSAELKNKGLCVDDWCGSVELPPYLWKRPLLPRWFHPCRFFYNTLIIFSNGKVGICPCRDFEADSDLILGDIRKDSLKELWKGRKHTTLLDNWRKKNIIPAICKKCSHYVY